MPETWPYVSSRTVRSQYYEIGKYGEAELRKRLPSPLYWIRAVGQGGRKTLWNVRLLQDYLLNGDRPDHQRLVERYLQTLPTTK
jgi:hypothetical protein